MSKALRTSKTEFIGIRMPHALLAEAQARAHANGYTVTQAVLAALRLAWHLPDLSSKETPNANP